MAFPKGAGSLKERVTFYRVERTRDEMGGYAQTETELGACFAQVNVTQSRDNVIADQSREMRTHEIIIRQKTLDVRQGDIAAWRGYRLVVRATRPVAHWLILDCVTEAA